MQKNIGLDPEKKILVVLCTEGHMVLNTVITMLENHRKSLHFEWTKVE